MSVGESEHTPCYPQWSIGFADKGEILRPNCAAFGHGSSGDEHVFGYVLEYFAAQHTVFPPDEYVSCGALVRGVLIFHRGK